MLSQLSKTIKLALKSTQEERAIMRARSAVQRFPVMQWRQRMEDFHRRAIGISRLEAGTNSWRPEDCARHRRADVAQNDADNSFGMDSRTDVDYSWPNTPTYATPPSPWSAEGDSYMRPYSEHEHQPTHAYSNHYLEVPQKAPSRRGSFHSEYSDEAQHYVAPYSDAGQDGPYNQFLARAERQIFPEAVEPPDTAALNIPRRDDRAASAESISSIVDEKMDSPLNQAMMTVRRGAHCVRLALMSGQFTDADGEAAQVFAARLQFLDANNSKGDLSIEKFLTKSEEAFFDRARRDKLVAAGGGHSQRNSFWSTFDEFELNYRPGCKRCNCRYLRFDLTLPCSFHGSLNRFRDPECRI